MQIWAGSGKSALPICNYSQILYQFLTFTQNLKRSLGMFRKSNRKNEPNKINATILVLLLHRFEFFCSQLEITDDKNCAADRDPHSIQPFRPLHTCCFLS